MVGHWCWSQFRYVWWVTGVGHSVGMCAGSHVGKCGGSLVWVTGVGHSVDMCGGSLVLVTV